MSASGKRNKQSKGRALLVRDTTGPFLSPSMLKKFHAGWVGFWLFLWAVATYLDWVVSVRFISHVTMATAVLTSFANWQTTRVEVNQERRWYQRK